MLAGLVCQGLKSHLILRRVITLQMHQFLKLNNLCMRGRKLYFFSRVVDLKICVKRLSFCWLTRLNEWAVFWEVRVYLFHIITVNISNFHREFCGVSWQALIALRHPSGEMMVLDGRQTLGVRLHDGGGGLITLLLPGTEPPVPGGLAWPCLRRGGSGTPHYLTARSVTLRAACTSWTSASITVVFL